MHVVFDESLITGDELIDSQHKELIQKVNSLLEACETSSGKVTAIQLLGYLAEYTDFHFNAEEELQKEIGYPGLLEHQKQHNNLRQVVADLHERLEEEGPTDDFVEQLNKNVIEWLCRHIKGFDRSVAEYKNMNINNERL